MPATPKSEPKPKPTYNPGKVSLYFDAATHKRLDDLMARNPAVESKAAAARYLIRLGDEADRAKS